MNSDINSDAAEDTAVAHRFEKSIYLSRWLLAPFYIGILAALILLLLKFGQELLHMVPHIFSMSEGDAILGVLSLVDISLIANLLVMVAFVGYDHFVSDRGGVKGKHSPSWLGTIDYNGLKLKAMGSIAAISAIQLLRAFLDTGHYSPEQMKWMVIIHLSIATSGVLLAYMDKIAHSYETQH